MNVRSYDPFALIKDGNLPKSEIVAFYLLYYLYHQHKRFGNGFTTNYAYELLADIFNLSEEQLNYKMNDGRNHWKNRVQYAKRDLKNKKLVTEKDTGYWIIEEKGIELMSLICLK
ncbi:winged helix-turn-helix domain-containing protein [Sporosarcina sp. UB5]|uniref:winged helix-turn-helix domain-containing protein n=1 Tax=Sporosarcina sp. UB5 TaxID=3047463 RepID=UPI003D7ACB79